MSNKIFSNHFLPEPVTITEQQWEDDVVPLVSVTCITFNHEHFIREAIEGFLMQKTTFPVEILIHDDASTDRTAEIVSEYERKIPKLFLITYQKENQYSQGINPFVAFQVPLARGKYIAACEGDDYWTDPLKLQKQVDFLEKNPGYALCFHDIYVRENEILKENTKSYGTEDKVISSARLFYPGGYLAPSASLVFPKAAVRDLPDWVVKSPVGDMPLKLILSQKGKIKYISDKMAVRRISIKGSWNDRIKNNPVMRFEYNLGMIKMLDCFYEYSNFRYKEEILRLQFGYHGQIIEALGFFQRIRIWFSGKYNPLAMDQSFIGLIKFNLLFLFPNILKYKLIYNAIKPDKKERKS